MIVKLNVSGGDKTLNQVYKEMIHNHKFKENYDRKNDYYEFYITLIMSFLQTRNCYLKIEIA